MKLSKFICRGVSPPNVVRNVAKCFNIDQEIIIDAECYKVFKAKYNNRLIQNVITFVTYNVISEI